jgi:hypothetical protein
MFFFLFWKIKMSSAAESKNPTKTAERKTPAQVLSEALAKAKSDIVRGGVFGLATMAVHVTSIMWLRTAASYQCRHGGSSMTKALSTLWNEGGIWRLYFGLPVAIIQAPLVRFGDIAAESGAISLVNELGVTRDLPETVKKVGASLISSTFRALLAPIDTLRISLQVDGSQALTILGDKLKTDGPLVLFRGALASTASIFVGHYPWYFTYNTLDARLPKYDNAPWKKTVRSAFIGLCASMVSDTLTSPIRVLKFVRVSSPENLSYVQAANKVIAEDGVKGLFLRGLTAQLAANGVQALVIVLLRLGQDYFAKKEKDAVNKTKAVAAATPAGEKK